MVLVDSDEKHDCFCVLENSISYQVKKNCLPVDTNAWKFGIKTKIRNQLAN